MKPVRPSLEAVRGATKDLVPVKKARAELLRIELVKIGDFIDEQIADEADKDLAELFW